MRSLFGFLLLVVLLIIGFTFCRSITARQDPAQLQTVPAQTPFATLAPLSTITPSPQSVAPVVDPSVPVENSEWYIDGWAEDVIVVNMYGREIRFDQAEFRNAQTNAAIVVQCIDPPAKRPNLDFTLPVERRDRFVYKGNQFWHTTDPAVQRFIFVRSGELQ